MRFLIALALVALVLAQNPPRPRLQETFEAHGTFRSEGQRERISGNYMWANDEADGKAAEHFQIRHPRDSELMEIQRYDMHRIFLVHEKSCTLRNTTGVKPPIWAWVANSRYAGIFPFDGRMLNLWKGTLNGQLMELGVSDKNANEPVYLLRNGTSGLTQVTFSAYAEHRPKQSWFKVPDVCNRA